MMNQQLRTLRLYLGKGIYLQNQQVKVEGKGRKINLKNHRNLQEYCLEGQPQEFQDDDQNSYMEYKVCQNSAGLSKGYKYAEGTWIFHCCTYGVFVKEEIYSEI